MLYCDPSGFEKIYILYGVKHGENGGFDDRAKAEYSYWIKQGYKKEDIRMVSIATEEQFVNEWAAMENNKFPIESVSLYFHSNAQNLIIDYTKDEYLKNGL